jgi:hypothetical protein
MDPSNGGGCMKVPGDGIWYGSGVNGTFVLIAFGMPNGPPTCKPKACGGLGFCHGICIGGALTLFDWRVR